MTPQDIATDVASIHVSAEDLGWQTYATYCFSGGQSVPDDQGGF